MYSKSNMAKPVPITHERLERFFGHEVYSQSALRRLGDDSLRTIISFYKNSQRFDCYSQKISVYMEKFGNSEERYSFSLALIEKARAHTLVDQTYLRGTARFDLSPEKASRKVAALSLDLKGPKQVKVFTRLAGFAYDLVLNHPEEAKVYEGVCELFRVLRMKTRIHKASELLEVADQLIHISEPRSPLRQFARKFTRTILEALNDRSPEKKQIVKRFSRRG